MTLSEADTCYWRHWAPRVWQTANPLPIAPGAYAPSPLSGNRLLWVGRIAPEKHPLEAVEILAAVRRQLPEATLTIVGAGDAALEKQLHQKIQALGLEQAVTCAGYQTELAPYYQQADILLSTSEFEGYALAMAEAQACGVPVVAWSLPHLSLLRSGRGSVSVPQGSVAASAEAVLVWLRHREALTQAGAEALANIQSLQVDQAEVWRGIFRSLEEPAVREAPADSLAMLQSLRGAVIAAHEQAQTPSLPRRIKRRLVRGKRELIFTLARWRIERNMKE